MLGELLPIEKFVTVCGSPDTMTFFEPYTLSVNLANSESVYYYREPFLRTAATGPVTVGNESLLKFLDA